MTNTKTLCFICNDETNKITYLCKGCSNEYCYEHLGQHRHLLNNQLEFLINDYNQFQQEVNQQKQNPLNSSLIEKINQWENESIENIQQIAKECRTMAIKYTKIIINDIQKKFYQLIQQLKQIQKENQFNEIDLNILKNQLTLITQKFIDPSNISIRQDSHKIYIETSIKSIYHKWKQQGRTIAGGNVQDEKLNQLSSPQGFFIDKSQTLFIADYDNHCIIKWKHGEKTGNIVAGHQKQELKNQLCYPTDVIIDEQDHSLIIADYGNRRVIRYFNDKYSNKQIILDNIDCYGLAMDNYGYFYVSDWKKNEIKRWKKGENNNAIIVAGGNGKGHSLNQLNRPTFIYVDDQQSIYISDSDNHRVIKWKKDANEGVIVAGGNGPGHGLHQISSPQGIVIDSYGQIYVVDYDNNRVMQFYEGINEGFIIIGEDDQGKQLLDEPRGLALDLNGNIYVGDIGTDRIIKFQRFIN